MKWGTNRGKRLAPLVNPVCSSHEAAAMIVANSPSPVKGWAKIPHVVTLNNSLTPTAKTVLAALLYIAKSRPSCSPMDAEIGKLVNRSARTVSVCLRSLEQHGLIRREATPRANVAGRVIHIITDDGTAKPVEARNEQPNPPLQDVEPIIEDRVPPRGEDPSSRGRSLSEEIEKVEKAEDAPTLIEALKPEIAEAVADRLIAIFRDDIAYRSKYVKAMRSLANGQIPLERGVYAAREASKRTNSRGIAFLARLESTTPIPGQVAKPVADAPEVVELLALGRSPDERERNAAVGSLIAKGFSLEEIRGLFSAAPPVPPISPVPSSPPSPGEYLRDLVRQYRRQGS